MPIQFSEPVDGKYHGEAMVLSGQVLRTKKHGRFAIDVETLVFHKERLTVDYNHDQDVILGYAENFRVGNDQLIADVYLTEGNAKVEEIVRHIKTGTPFEISPSINEEEGLLEHDGDIKRYKHVPMRGVSICPFGTDRFTSLTLLHEETMSKQKNLTTNLSDENAAGESPEVKVKDPDLAEFREVYGLEKGYELWQSGADINDVRTLKELIEKYGVPEPPGTASTEPTELNEEDPLTKPAEEKEKENTELKAVVTALKAGMTKLSAEVTKLSAAIPRGETAPVKHNYETDTQKQELSAKEQYLQSFNKRFQK